MFVASVINERLTRVPRSFRRREACDAVNFRIIFTCVEFSNYDALRSPGRENGAERAESIVAYLLSVVAKRMATKNGTSSISGSGMVLRRSCRADLLVDGDDGFPLSEDSCKYRGRSLSGVFLPCHGSFFLVHRRNSDRKREGQTLRSGRPCSRERDI